VPQNSPQRQTENGAKVAKERRRKTGIPSDWGAAGR